MRINVLFVGDVDYIDVPTIHQMLSEKCEKITFVRDTEAAMSVLEKDDTIDTVVICPDKEGELEWERVVNCAKNHSNPKTVAMITDFMNGEDKGMALSLRVSRMFSSSDLFLQMRQLGLIR